ncbi:50S ribosomal protein L24 [secondary endosymbiont of Trabutina mannipara]|uniref:Large ribosomal subunit protein uL24 n=1 Tax=secondary endosymbiont of Trabutina mannipara TaxID=1835721 RepID=A0A1C3L4A0_9ENTR|nr:50S ribosomal protein L24 [secondary endosymbiont of Trabutina mannipara]SBT82102.1 50S ribosomal protein L24 [secondary endosymbiont of Trabutina mannipara]
MAAKICIDDEVIVITGKDKGKRGKIKTILPNGKCIINGINLVKKHKKLMPNNSGGILKKESKIDLSNIAIFNLATNKADRVGFKIENSNKFRIFKSNGKLIK